MSQLAKLTLLSADQRRYLALVKRERAVDRAHYRSTHHWLHPVLAISPERHYIALGEEMGLSPSPTFVPKVYLHLNPEIPDDATPLQHFLTVGRAGGLAAVEQTDVDPGSPEHLTQQSAVAVVAHVHYLDIWSELVDQLRRSSIEADLFITTTGPQTRVHQIAEELGDWCPNRSITLVPNRGRDASSFVHLVNSGVLDGYQAVCKIHTKQSPGRGGDIWRRELLDAILPTNSSELISSFLADEDAQVMTSAAWIQSGENAWGSNQDRVAALLPANDVDELPSFPAGAMYWVKQPVLEQIKGLRLSYHDFEPELGRVDGTTAHAFERMIGFLCQRVRGAVVPPSIGAAQRLEA